MKIGYAIYVVDNDILPKVTDDYVKSRLICINEDLWRHSQVNSDYEVSSGFEELLRKGSSRMADCNNKWVNDLYDAALRMFRAAECRECYQNQNIRLIDGETITKVTEYCSAIITLIASIAVITLRLVHVIDKIAFDLLGFVVAMIAACIIIIVNLACRIYNKHVSKKFEAQYGYSIDELLEAKSAIRAERAKSAKRKEEAPSTPDIKVVAVDDVDVVKDGNIEQTVNITLDDGQSHNVEADAVRNAKRVSRSTITQNFTLNAQSASADADDAEADDTEADDTEADD